MGTMPSALFIISELRSASRTVSFIGLKCRSTITEVVNAAHAI